MCEKGIKRIISVLKMKRQVKWLLIMLMAGNLLFLCVDKTQLFSQQQNSTWEVKNGLEGSEIYSDIQKGNCRLCNHSKDDVFSMYQKTDGIGIIHLSEWAVIDLEIDSNITDEKRYTQVSTNTIGMSTFKMITTPARRLCEVEVGLNRINQVNVDKMAGFLCEDCIGEILQENIYEFALINFQTKEIIPLNNIVNSFFVGDYYICCHWGESGVELLVVYTPFKID